MGKQLIVKFTVGTSIVGSGISEQKEILVDKNATEEEIEGEIGQAFNEWVWDHINAEWEIEGEGE